MKWERTFLKRLAQQEISSDEFYEKTEKFTKPKKAVPKVKKSKNNWNE